MERERSLPSSRHIIDVIRRANQIATVTQLDQLLDRTLALLLEVAEAEAGTFYLYDAANDELIFKTFQSDTSSTKLIKHQLPAADALAKASLQARTPIFVEDIAHDARWEQHPRVPGTLKLRTVYSLPLMLQERPVGVVQLFNVPTRLDDENLVLLGLLDTYVVSAIEKTRLLDEAKSREQRLSALVDIISNLTTTLDRSQILTQIMNYARELLHVEATSVWELDEQRNLLVLHVATGEHGAQLHEVTVPFGQGIIGECVASGKRILVDDVAADPRWNRTVDQQSGFETRSILSVPLRAPRIYLGPERGELKASIIGGAQALNKRGGAFSDDDIALFETLANQAATVLQISRLNEDTYKLFMAVIKVVAEAVDAKDPYTQGHSERVAEFSVAIAEEMGQTTEEIAHIRIGGILHDVGKIGVPDAILGKVGGLTRDEFDEIKKHPLKGHKIMSQDELRWRLRAELPALLQHHERLDGTGYPHGIGGDEIEPIARIVHVADVLDALTSDRPYHPARSAEEAFAILVSGKDTDFDPVCVDALLRARTNGKIVLQKERMRSQEPEIRSQESGVFALTPGS